MIALSWIAGILVAGMLLFAFSSIRLKIRFAHREGDDEVTVDARGLYGLIRLRYSVPVIGWGEKGLILKTETINRIGERLIAGDDITITREKIEQFVQRSKWLLAYTARFVEWTKAVMARTVCTELTWVSRIGLGDAADTAIATGVVWGLKTSLLGLLFRHIRLQARPSLSVQPQFNRMQFTTEGVCVLKLRVAYALYAIFLLLHRILRVKGGLKAWRKLLFHPS